MRILHEDELLDFMKRNTGRISNPLPNMYTFETLNTDEEDLVTNNNGEQYVYQSFNFTTENKAQIEQIVNYNADEFYNLVNQLGEPELFSIYHTTLAEDTAFSENPSRDLFLESNYSDLIASNFRNPKIISINPNLSISATSEYKGIFPTFVNITFPPVNDNEMIGALESKDVYNGMVESLYKVPPVVETYLTSMGSLSLDTHTISSLVDGIPSDFSGLNYTHIGDFDPNIDFYTGTFDATDKISLEYDLLLLAKELAPRYSSIVSDPSLSVKNQILGYRIDKHIQGNNNPIQTFFTPAIDGNQPFIDTQVKFGTNYQYIVTAIVAVYGFTYNYTTNIQNGKAKITVNQTPFVKIINLPILDRTVKIAAFAPTTPEVSFLNKSNEEKRLRFYFEPSYHETREDFILIEQTDQERQEIAQIDLQNKMIFKYSEELLTYEIFKLNQKPKSYEDFKGALYTTVKNSSPANSELFELYLTPNRKFYFMFRSRNEFQLSSNPSAVFELELIKDSDETRVSVKTIDFKEETGQKTKTFGRFMKIYPAFDQTVLNDYSSELNPQTEYLEMNNNQYYVGDPNSPIWGRKFKIRVRSNNTGKVVDLNVDFVLNKVDSEENLT